MLFAASLACAAIQIALAGRPIAFVAVNAVALAIVLLVCVEIHRRRAVARSNDAILFLLVFCLFIVGSIHDIGMDPSVDGWRGLGFYTAPYYGFIFTSVFLYTLARRASHAFGALETANQTLQDRVEQTRRDLLASEARRRELEVASAIETERERVMREIHDGIGANLVGALSAARGQDASGIAVRTLERALLDLKMTVDSLEPVGGDVAALLGNFRHRIEADLTESGVACRWTADACRPLAWLDAPNALHLLRIYQEAFGNILLHAGARAIAFGCREESRDGRPGVLTFVEDDGRGFCVDAPGGGGHGLRNMQARATSIHAELSLTSTPGAGVRITVWLPYER
jgi:signal transduction histidine kinase